MAETEIFDDAARHAWACDLFGVKPASSPQEIRAAVVARLEEADFMPPAAWRQAIWLLCSPQAPQNWREQGYDAFRSAMEGEMAKEIEDFAAKYFALPCNARQVRWNRLRKRAEPFPQLRARIALLKPALEIPPSAGRDQDPLEATLRDRVQQLIVLAPGVQDQKRREWLATTTGDWRETVRKFKARHPALARLEPDFLAALASPKRSMPTPRPESKIGAPRFPTELFPAEQIPQQPAERFSAARSSASSRSKSSSGLGGVGWGVFIAISMCLRGIISCSDHNSTNNYRFPTTPPISRPINLHPETIDELIKAYKLVKPMDSRAASPKGSAGKQPFLPKASGNHNMPWTLPDFGTGDYLKGSGTAGERPFGGPSDPRNSTPLPELDSSRGSQR